MGGPVVLTPAPSRVVILGAGGHVGGALQARLAAAGVDVVGHSSQTLDLTRREALGALDSLAGPGTALVFAAALTPDHGQTLDTLGANLAMAINVARWLETRRVGGCVYVSSDSVYGFDVNPVTEATPVAPAGYYALAKLAGERILEPVAAAHGVPLVSVRLPAVYGPGDRHGAYGPNAFARSLARDRTVRLFGAGEEERDHLFVADAAGVIAALMRAGATGVFNVASGESVPFAKIVELIRGLVPYDVTVTSAPRKGPVTHRRYDTTKLRAVIGDYRFTPLEEGLRATLAAFGAL